MTLKTYVQPIYNIHEKGNYFNIWECILTNEGIVAECKNILDIIKLLLITPFSNAKLKCMLSQMFRVKNDW